MTRKSHDGAAAGQEQTTGTKEIFDDATSHSARIMQRLGHEQTRRSIAQTGAFWSEKISLALGRVLPNPPGAEIIVLDCVPGTTAEDKILERLCVYHGFQHVSVQLVSADIGKRLMQSIVLPSNGGAAVADTGFTVDEGNLQYDAIVGLLQNCLSDKFLVYAVLQYIGQRIREQPRWVVTGMHATDIDEVLLLGKHGRARLLYVNSQERENLPYTRKELEKFLHADQPMSRAVSAGQEEPLVHAGWKIISSDDTDTLQPRLTANLAKWWNIGRHRDFRGYMQFLAAWFHASYTVYLLAVLARFFGQPGKIIAAIIAVCCVFPVALFPRFLQRTV